MGFPPQGFARLLENLRTEAPAGQVATSDGAGGVSMQAGQGGLSVFQNQPATAEPGEMWIIENEEV